jgi:hypothetical protein
LWFFKGAGFDFSFSPHLGSVSAPRYRPTVSLHQRVNPQTACPARVSRKQAEGPEPPANEAPVLQKRKSYMANEKNDQPVLSHIDQLVKEEERLYAKNALTDEDQARLAEVKVELDQCWDLLRQRRALREFGEDPDKAKVRPAKIVENYEQ